MALAKYTPKDYYNSKNQGYYQFVTLTDVISNFMVSYVGDDKIIKNTKRSEVSYHAQRTLQELSYDTIDNVKSIEVEIPPSMSIPIPHDFVSYVRITCLDEAGIERPLKPNQNTTAPVPYLQDDEYNYLYDDKGNVLIAKESEAAKRFKGQKDNSYSTTDASDITYLEEGYGYNVDYGKRYGIDPISANKNDTFIIDQPRGVISFSSGVKNKIIIIKYVSDGLNIDGDMQIHKFAEEAMYKSIALGIMSAKANIPEYQINRLKKEKKAALRSAKLRLANINIEDLTQIMRGKSKQIKH
jgi:ABC-type antimicrobial peptide transport system permease subunit